MSNKETATLVPKLRFPEFRGVDGWCTTPLSELGEVVTGKTPSTKEDKLWGGGILFITPTDITEDGKYQHSTQRTVVETRGTKVLPPNSVVYTCIASIGKMALTVVPSVSNQQINAVVPNGKTAREFIYYSLANLTPWIKSIPATSTLPIINKTQFSGFIIPHPKDKSEQQKIADCLSSLDELIAAQARKVDALKTQKKGLMQQLFPREGETQPRLRFPEFRSSGEWNDAPLSNFILSLDAGVSVNSGDRPAGKTEFGILKTSAVTDGIFEPEENKVVLSEGEQSRLKEPVSCGSIIISRMNTPALVGANAYVESSHENLFLPDRLWAAKPKEGASMRFLAFVLGSDKGRTALSKLAKGSSGSMKNITKPEVLAFSVIAPSPAEQQRIADCLTSLDTLINFQTQALETLKTHKKGLMQQLFPAAEAVEA